MFKDVWYVNKNLLFESDLKVYFLMVIGDMVIYIMKMVVIDL